MLHALSERLVDNELAFAARQPSTAAEMEALVDAFGEAAKGWGWESDQGVGEAAAQSFADFEKARASLLCRIAGPTRHRGPEEAIGWAVAEQGKVFVKMVSDTRRAAIVNWLVAVAGATVLRIDSDQTIERLFGRLGHSAEVVEVRVLVATRTSDQDNLR